MGFWTGNNTLSTGEQMFKRKLFFWLEKLKITPAERMTITGLIVLMMVLGILNLVLTPSSPFSEDYSVLEEQFRQRTEFIEARERELMKRYEPPVAQPEIVKNNADTITADTAQDHEQITAEKKAQSLEINVNTASLNELQELPGIGPAYSKRIIEYRKKHGGFSAVDELIKIKGIGKKRLEKLQPFVKLKDPD